MNIKNLQARVNQILKTADTVADAKRLAREDGKVKGLFLEIVDEIIDDKMAAIDDETMAEVEKIRAIGLDFFRDADRKCDKCNQDVRADNSALRLSRLAGYPLCFSLDRHLYPIGDCEGSPSRVKSIESDPAWTAAYREMQTQRS